MGVNVSTSNKLVEYITNEIGTSYNIYFNEILSNGIDDGILALLTLDEFNTELLSLINVNNIIHKKKLLFEFNKYYIGKPIVNKTIDNNTLKSQIECPICLESMFNPSCLNCGHSCCLECIQNCIIKNIKFCVVCRLPFTNNELNNNGKNLKINLTLRDLINIIDPDSVKEKLNLYEEKKIADLENKKLLDIIIKSPKILKKIVCPGYQLRIRPQPNLTDDEVGYIQNGNVVEIYSEEINGFYKLVNNIGFLLINARGTTYENVIEPNFNNTIYKKIICPGYQIRIRPQPNLFIDEVGFVQNGDTVHVFVDEVNGFYKLVDNRGYLLINAIGATYANIYL